MYLYKFIDYLSYEKKYSIHTIRSYKSDIEGFLIFLKKNDTPIDNDLNYSFIRQWIVELAESKISTVTINRKISSLKSYFKFLVTIGCLSKSPTEGHRNLKTKGTIVEPFSEKEIEKIFKNFSNHDVNERDKLIIEFLYCTGVRRQELINLKVSDINFETQLIRVLGKRNKERLVPMLPNLKHSIEKYLLKNKSEYLFSSKNGGMISKSTIYRIINKYFRKVSTKVKLSPHVLRHTFATHLLNNGADINSIKEILGHNSLSSTQIYTKIKMPKIISDYKKSHPREI
tara:strand:- start:2172 stop:3029 length:858 start_codon:yes stop_codon:yes gene_type:complete